MVPPLSAPSPFVSLTLLSLLKRNTKRFSQTCKQTEMAGEEREVSAVFVGTTIYLSRSSQMFRVTLTLDSKHWIGYVGFSSFFFFFFSKIKVLWKYLV